MPFCSKMALQLRSQPNTRSFTYLQQGEGTALDSVRKSWCRAGRLRAGRFKNSRLGIAVRSFLISCASFHTNVEIKLKTLITHQTTASQNVGGILLLRSMFDNDSTVNTEY